MPLVTCPDCAAQVSDAAPSCPQCGKPAPLLVPVARKAPPIPTWAAIAVVGVAVLGVAAVAMSPTSGQHTASADTPPVPITVAPVVEKQSPNPFARLTDETRLASAIALLRPAMSDVTGGEDSRAAIALALWSAVHLTWIDVAVREDETSYALVQKDPEAARGKRVCLPGTIIEIHTDRSAGAPIFEGLIQSSADNLFRFLTVGSSGSIVGGSWARLCGVVTGRYDYPNSAGGVGHAVEIVGMFDLPENKSPPARATNH